MIPEIPRSINNLSESPLGDGVCQLGEDELQHLQGDGGQVQEDSSVILVVDTLIRGPHS